MGGKIEVSIKDIPEIMEQVNKLKERIAYLERSNNRREDMIQEQREEISDLEDIIDKAIELTENLLNADEIEIDDITYYKGNADDLVAKKYLEILKGDSNV